MFRLKIQVSPIWIGLLLGIGMVLMIPISDNVLAKPVFDGSSVGIGCSQTYDKIMKLRDKKAKEGLSQAEASELGAAESNYNDICKDIYGGLPREVLNSKIPRIPLENNAGVIVDDQSQNNQNLPPLSSGIINNGQIADDSLASNNIHKSPGITPEGGLSVEIKNLQSNSNNDIQSTPEFSNEGDIIDSQSLSSGLQAKNVSESSN